MNEWAAKLITLLRPSSPLSVLQSAVRSGTQILVALRNNRKLLGRVKAFDRHANMVRSLSNLLKHHTDANDLIGFGECERDVVCLLGNWLFP